LKLETLTQEGLDELVSSKDTAETKVGELTSQLGERDAKLGEINGTIAELRQSITSKDTEIGEATTSTTELTAKLEKATNGLTSAIQSYKEMMLKANPTIPEELIKGDTIEAVDQSLESAKTLVAQVRTTIEAELAAGKVPAGAPARTPPDLSSLSPREKIKYAIGGKK
jgi:chromosome segregation ATPase